MKGLIEGLVDAIDFANDNPEEAEAASNAGIEAVTGAALPEETIAGAWENLTFTWDPIASSLAGSKDAAVEVGLLDPVELDGIYELDLLNEVLEDRGEGRGGSAMNSASRTDWSEDTAVPAMLAGPLPAVALRQVSKAYGHGPAAEVTEQLREEVRRHAHD